MFNGKKQKYTREILTETINEYGESISTYTSTDSINMFVSLQSENFSESNNMRIQQCTHIGLTEDSVEVGDLIGSKYTVTFINNAGREKIVYMKELESNGCF